MTVSLFYLALVDIMEHPCKSIGHIGFLIATSKDGNAQFTKAKAVVKEIFKDFSATGIKAGVTTLVPSDGSHKYFKETEAALLEQLNSLSAHIGKINAVDLVTSIEEVILQMTRDAPVSSNKVILMLVDTQDLDLTELDTIAPLIRRELVLNNIKLFVVATGSAQKGNALKSLTAYSDEVLVTKSFGNLLENDLKNSVALSLCHVTCKY